MRMVIRGPGPFGPAREAAGRLLRGRHRYRGPVSGLGGLPRQLARTERLRGPRAGCSSENWVWWGPSPVEDGADLAVPSLPAPRPSATVRATTHVPLLNGRRTGRGVSPARAVRAGLRAAVGV